jgi:hypothetical protein
MQSSLRVLLFALAACTVSIAAFFFISRRFSVDVGRTADLERRVRRLESRQSAARYSMFNGAEHLVSADRPVSGGHGLRLSADATQTNRFEIRAHYKIPNAARPVAAWISQWAPRSDILKFDELYLVPHPDTGEVELVAKARPGETIDISFEIHMLVGEFLDIPLR